MSDHSSGFILAFSERPLITCARKSRDLAEFAHARRRRAGHATDRFGRSDGCVEEPPAELVATLATIVASSFDEIGFGPRTRVRRRHEPSKARSRSSAMTSS
jgi:hypothetical protein